MSDSHPRYYIHPDSMKIFEPQWCDSALYEGREGYIALYFEGNGELAIFSIYKDSCSYPKVTMHLLKNIERVQLTRRDGKTFIMPKEEI